MSGSLDYREFYYGSGMEACSATLSLSDDDASRCSGCTWSVGFTVEVDGLVGTCRWLSQEHSFRQGDTHAWRRFDWTEDAWDGSASLVATYQSMSGSTSESTIYAVSSTGSTSGGGDYVPATGLLTFGDRNISRAPVLFDDCGLEEGRPDSAGEPTATYTQATGTLAFDSAYWTADVWSVPVSAGETLNTRLQWTKPGMSMNLELVRPDGCRLGEGSGNNCAEEPSDCPTVSYTAESSGTWMVLVWGYDARDEGAYVLDAWLGD